LNPGVIERAFDLGVKLTYRRFDLGACDAYVAPLDSRGIAHGVTPGRTLCNAVSMRLRESRRARRHWTKAKRAHRDGMVGALSTNSQIRGGSQNPSVARGPCRSLRPSNLPLQSRHRARADRFPISNLGASAHAVGPTVPRVTTRSCEFPRRERGFALPRRRAYHDPSAFAYERLWGHRGCDFFDVH